MTVDEALEVADWSSDDYAQVLADEVRRLRAVLAEIKRLRKESAKLRAELHALHMRPEPKL